MKKEFETPLFAQAMAACTDGLVIADAAAQDMPLVYVNEAFERLTGYCAQEVLGRNCRFLQRGDTDQLGLALVRSALENGDACVVTVRNYRKDGSPFWNELSLSPMSNSAGTVTHFLGKLSDVSERVLAEQKLLAKHKQLLARKRELENLALRDGLTGLYNRRAFDEQLEREWNRARRDQTPLSLIMIDIDHFKRFNDTFGHPAGDHCIQVVASTVQRCFARGSDLVARYGGDEFVVLASAMDRKQAQQRAEQLREKIKTLGFASGGYATAPPVSLSIGVATATPLQKGTPDHLLNAADRALYQAKRRPDRDAEPVARTCTTRASSRGPAHPALSTSI
jgi:diguanylate cyclase (GGDEF)-like protein/PAS domain S-box-containing protein